jgi:hypothetical protein
MLRWRYAHCCSKATPELMDGIERKKPRFSLYSFFVIKYRVMPGGSQSSLAAIV